MLTVASPATTPIASYLESLDIINPLAVSALTWTLGGSIALEDAEWLTKCFYGCYKNRDVLEERLNKLLERIRPELSVDVRKQAAKVLADAAVLHQVPAAVFLENFSGVLGCEDLDALSDILGPTIPDWLPLSCTVLAGKVHSRQAFYDELNRLAPAWGYDPALPELLSKCYYVLRGTRVDR